jgi:hypothetical protein
VPRRVQDLGDHAVGRLQVPHRVGQDGTGAPLRGKLGHAGRPVRAAGCVEMVNDLDDGLAPEPEPAVQGTPREV